MHTSHLVLIGWLTLSLGTAGCVPSGPDDGGDPRDDDGVPPLVLGACDLTLWPPGFPPAPSELECGIVDVPARWEQPDGPTLPLLVARQRARSVADDAAERDAVFQIAGGPGGSSVAQSGLVPLLLPGLREDFDLVYVDQRGTGASGYLDCGGGLFPETASEWRSCAADTQVALDADYSSRAAAHDIDLVRRRLGYRRVAVRGGSYGTRVGLELLRDHPDGLSAVVLDGVDPPDSDFFGWTIGKVDVGVQLLVDDCSADDACRAIAPDLGGTLLAHRAALDDNPRPISIGGQPYLEDGALFAQLLGAFVEDDYWRPRVPRAIQHAADGDSAAWNTLIGELTGATVVDRADLSDSYVAPGLYLVVNCTESLPNAAPLDELEDAAAALTWGDGHLLDVIAGCDALGAPPADAALLAPVTSDVPTLLLSGAADIQTPPAWGDQALATLGDAVHVVIPHATHAVMRTPCGASLIEAFLAGATRGGTADPAALDLSCLDDVPAPAW